MSGDLNKLYSSTIRSNNDSPYHFQKRTSGQSLKAYNPVCGDRFEIFVEAVNGKIQQLHFHGFGCAVSKASASVMVRLLEGKSINSALNLCNNFLGYIDQQLNEQEILSPDFNAFSAVHEFPERYDCATLVWKEMKKYLTFQNV